MAKETVRDEVPREAAKRDRPMSAFDRLVAQAMGENRVMGLPDDPTQVRCPELWRFLSTVYVGRDKLVTPASVTVQLGPEGALVRLMVRDMAHQLGVGCPHVDGWADALEAALTAPNTPWQSLGKKEPQLRTRKLKS